MLPKRNNFWKSLTFSRRFSNNLLWHRMVIIYVSNFFKSSDCCTVSQTGKTRYFENFHKNQNMLNFCSNENFPYSSRYFETKLLQVDKITIDVYINKTDRLENN